MACSAAGMLTLCCCCGPYCCLQVIDETHQAYVRLKSGKRANTEELSLI